MPKRKLKPRLSFLSLLLLLPLGFIFALLTVALLKPAPVASGMLLGTETDNTQSARLYLEAGARELLSADYANFDQDYDIERTTQPAGTVRIPVLTYHHVGPVPSSPRLRDYYVSPEVFEQQLIYLEEKGYETLTPAEFYEILQSGKNPVRKSVLLTFDDGHYDNYQYAFPLLKKYGFSGTFYMPSARRAINNSQIKEMVAGGMVVEPHGKTHLLLSKVTDLGILADEITNSKASLESVTGQKVYSFCYPGCEYNGSAVSTLANSGYSLAFSCGLSIDHKYRNRYYLSRVHVYDKMDHFISILSGKFYYPY